MNLPFGTQVAIVDDKPEEIESIKINLSEQNVGYKFYDASPDNDSLPENPIETIETVFLDLHYGERGLQNFDPERPATWINRLIPENHKYFLIAWTFDTDDFIEVLNVLSKINKAPYAFLAAQKNDYQIEGNNRYDISKLFTDIRQVQEKITTTDLIPGQIIDIEDDGKVLIKCRISETKPIFQVRRFDKELFDDKNLKPEVNSFITIQITTEPGIRTIELFKTSNDLKSMFEVEDYFKEFNNSKFIGGQ